MAMKKTKCFLCGDDATFMFTDYENRKYFECSNHECGNYEISKRAESSIESNESSKKQLSLQSRSCVNKGELLEIIYNEEKVSSRCKNPKQ